MVSGSKLCGLLIKERRCALGILYLYSFSNLRQIPRMTPRLTPEKVKARSRFLAIQALIWSLRAFWVPGFILKWPGALPEIEALEIFGPARNILRSSPPPAAGVNAERILFCDAHRSAVHARFFSIFCNLPPAPSLPPIHKDYKLTAMQEVNQSVSHQRRLQRSRSSIDFQATAAPRCRIIRMTS